METYSIFAYQIRKSKVFVRERNSYLTLVVCPMGWIKNKKISHVVSTKVVFNWFQVVQINNWSCITSPPAYPDVNGDVDVTKTMPTQ